MLTEKDKETICKEYKVEKNRAVNVIELSKRFGVPQQTIRNIAKKKDK
jgi:DeoR/GlpR family transcriptional regulator of sugar metabolism